MNSNGPFSLYFSKIVANSWERIHIPTAIKAAIPLLNERNRLDPDFSQEASERNVGNARHR